jgi:hypothetical protein
MVCAMYMCLTLTRAQFTLYLQILICVHTRVNQSHHHFAIVHDRRPIASVQTVLDAKARHPRLELAMTLQKEALDRVVGAHVVL